MNDRIRRRGRNNGYALLDGVRNATTTCFKRLAYAKKIEGELKLTTIVYAHGVLAFDSLVTAKNGESERKDSTMIKGIKTDSYLAAGAGDIECVQAFLLWIQKDFKDKYKPEYKRDADFEMLVVDYSGKVITYINNLLPQKTKALLKDCYVLGDGADLALGALAMGATAEQAVKIAAKYNPSTGGKIRTLTWKENETIKTEDSTLGY